MIRGPSSVQRGDPLGTFLLFVGFAINTLAGLVIAVKAFKVSIGWGLAVLFVPFVGLIFIIKYWQDTKTTFFAGIGGGVLMLVGVFVSVANAPDQPTVASQSASESSSDDDSEEPPASFASAAAAPASYEPPRNTSYAPTTTYTPSYAPPPVASSAPVAAVTETQPAEDEWTRKPKLEQVYVDRDTYLFYSEKCKKRPQNVYRIPRTIALAQGLTEAKCR